MDTHLGMKVNGLWITPDRAVGEGLVELRRGRQVVRICKWGANNPLPTDAAFDTLAVPPADYDLLRTQLKQDKR